MIIPFAEWLPDLPAFNNQGATIAKNVIPHARSYLAVPQTQIVSEALDGACLGAVAAQDNSAVTYNYAGDATKLYSLIAGAYVDISGSTYATLSPNRWSFTRWGEKIIATNYANTPQVITMGGANFSDLGGSPPKAKYIGVVGDFVVLGNVNDGTDRSNRVQWSAINDETNWVPSAATQSDYQDLQGNGGSIQAVVGGEYGVIFQEHSIWRMTYIGSPLVFQFDEVETGKGTPAPYSVISIGSSIFYLGWDGFYLFNGSQSVNISVNKVSKTFYADLDQDFTGQVVATIDPINTVVLWLYHGAGHTGVANKIITYNWSNGRWSEIEVELEHVTTSRSSAYTLEELDTYSPSIDLIPISLDSRGYKGGTILMAGFDANHRLIAFTGEAMEGVIDTQEIQFNPSGTAHVSAVRPLIDGNSFVQIGTRKLHTDLPVFSGAVSMDSEGKCSFRSDARYHRIRLTTSGEFGHAEGVDVEFTPTGAR